MSASPSLCPPPAANADVRDRLLSENLRLVHFVARQLARSLAAVAEFDELVSCGTLGLINAINAFDPARGLAFSTFAIPRIRGAILDEIRRQDRVPRTLRRKMRDVKRASESVERRTGHAATGREIADSLGVEVGTYWQWQVESEWASTASLDVDPSYESDRAPRVPAKWLAAESDPVEERLDRDAELKVMREALSGLGEQERTVLTLYYFEELKQSDIATLLEVSESRISQVRTRALAKLREQMAPMRRAFVGA